MKRDSYLFSPIRITSVEFAYATDARLSFEAQVVNYKDRFGHIEEKRFTISENVHFKQSIGPIFK